MPVFGVCPDCKEYLGLERSEDGMTYHTNIYSLPEVMVIHTIAQFVDAYLFIYLVNRFFTPRKGKFISRKHTVIMTILLAAVLFFVDIIFDNEFYAYYITILLLPLLYSLLFFRESLATKIIICSIFTSLIVSFENVIIKLPDELVNPNNNYAIFLFLFFLRRIGVKMLLVFLIKKLFPWPRESSIQMPTPCWFLILTVSIGDNLLLVFWRLPADNENYVIRIAGILFLVMLPMVLLMMMKYLANSAEKNQVISAQIALSKTQNQYLMQQLEMTEALRKFRHDYKAHLFCMDTLLSAGKYEELHQYLVSLHQYQYEGVHLRRFVDDESLNIILNQKVTMAEKYGIRFETNIVIPNTGKIVISDLNSLIVNLCDNAIEACATLPNARISLDIHKVKVYLIIEITNTSKNDVQKTNPGFYTHKSNPEFHGMGIKIIKSITKKYNGQYQVFTTDHSFTTNLMLQDE